MIIVQISLCDEFKTYLIKSIKILKQKVYVKSGWLVPKQGEHYTRFELNLKLNVYKVDKVFVSLFHQYNNRIIEYISWFAKLMWMF